MSTTDELSVAALRLLSIDMVERARSGHPGLPLGAAPMAYALWDRVLRHAPTDPDWFDRDRFVLSAGHGSALLYALLHLTGYDLPIAELERFRQLGSRAAGHPEHGLTPGVEVTTGPLGQGFANGVGFAMAEHALAERFNRPGHTVIDHWTYALCSDGDMMEGIAAEAASFAGQLGVRKLLYLYDDNRVSLDGPTSLSFGEDVDARFRSYGWGVRSVEDGNDIEAIAQAIAAARGQPERPQLVRVRTHIGYGSPKQDTSKAHGEALGPDAVRATRSALGFPELPEFGLPTAGVEHLRTAVERGRLLVADWSKRVGDYRKEFPQLADELDRVRLGRPPAGWSAALDTLVEREWGAIATRDASQVILQTLGRAIPELLGGSADLASSTKTTLDGAGTFRYDGPSGRNIHFGVRENAMVAILNGLAMHGGLRPYGSTFLVFSDYARPAIRLAALMQARVTLVFTHDTVALGEDGPTHQPIEHLASLRAIPGLTVFRPADAVETLEGWRTAMERAGPVALVLTRQKLPPVDRTRTWPSDGPRRGGYVAADPPGRPPTAVLVATGSEVVLALEAARHLEAEGRPVRVVSLPSWELFEEQPSDYRSSVLPPGLPVVAIEAASPFGWERFVGPSGRIVGLRRFGASGPGAAVYAELGFTVEAISAAVRSLAQPSSPPPRPS